jgi:hypothetical protein
MTRDSFKFISKHVAITFPEELSISNKKRGKPDPLGRVRWLLTHLNLRFEDCSQAPREQSIDEGMVRFKGRCSTRQSVANKPIRKRFKVFKRCDSKGYTYHFEVYKGMRASENHEAQDVPSTENKVLDLSRSFREKGHIVAFDRFFSTVPLIDRLHETGINAVGTIDSRKAFQSILFEKNRRKNQFVGRIGGQIDRGEGKHPTPCKAIFMWKDTKTFRVISNYHGSDLTEVQRMNRNGDIRNVTRPKAIVDYGKFMGGVDRANQYASYYERDRRSKKWWHRIFYSLLEMTLVNSWICFNELMDNVNKRDDMTILNFKRRVTMGLLAKGLNIGKPAGRAGNLEGTVHPINEFQNKRRKSRLSTRN